MLLTIFIGHLKYHLSFCDFIPLFFLTPIKLYEWYNLITYLLIVSHLQ